MAIQAIREMERRGKRTIISTILTILKQQNIIEQSQRAVERFIQTCCGKIIIQSINQTVLTPLYKEDHFPELGKKDGPSLYQKDDYAEKVKHLGTDDHEPEFENLIIPFVVKKNLVHKKEK
jgi:hypothetical protein